MGPNDFYTMFHLAGREVGAAATLRPEQKAAGVPPNWMLYIAVENADASAALAAKAGGKLLAPPFDVMDAGRMAVIQDPTGAAFCIWQSNRNTGIQVAGEHGSLCWADLNTPNPELASKFYSEVFGWKFTPDTHSNPPAGYIQIQNGEDYIGGIPPQGPPMPPHWMGYFLVDNCDASSAKAKSLSGRICLEPMDIEHVGRMSVVSDPQGAVFAIFQPGQM